MAKDYHIKLLQAAVNLGATDRKNELDTLVEKRGPETPENSVDAAFAAKFKPLFESIKPMMETNRMAGFRTYFEGLKGLQKEFPAHPQIYIGLSECASQFPPEEAKVILREIATNSLAMAQVREQAEATLQRLEMYGKSIEIQYKAVDGQDVDTVKLRGKVVLVDFWATWCGPCIRALPEVKAAYEKLHAKGFEVVAISLDEDKEALDRFLKKNEIPWPQYFDGKGWQNTFAKQYGIQAIPATWLLDKKGKLREMETRDGLEGKIEKLLAED
jgi:thiol-disulfide isomerase/thioredoxin